MKDKLTIIKVGGAVLNDNKIFKTFLNNFSKIKEKKILVHGGGIIASNYLVRLGIPPKFIKGRRITDEKTIKIAEKVLSDTNERLSGKVVTKISLLKNYCPAEEYHQKYLEKR